MLGGSVCLFDRKSILLITSPIFESEITIGSELLFTLFLSASAMAKEIKGKVTDETGGGLPGVTITEKGTFNGAITDIDGKFTINVKNDNATLVFSFVGYTSQEVIVGNQSMLNISMAPDASNLEEVVVVAYGTQKKVTVTGAVVAVQGEKLIKSPSVDLTNSLSGRLPGLVVVQQSGEPGADGATI